MVEIQEKNNTEESVDIKDISLESSKLDNLKDLTDLSKYEAKIKLPKPDFAKLDSNESILDKKWLNLQKTKESVEVKWNLANIKEVKNMDGNTILECKWATPYINVNALEDIIWFAQEFYEITGDALSINNSFRTISYQDKLKKMKWDNAAESWKSWHNLWLSIDMDRTDRYDPQNGWLKWMEALAEKHNFSRTIASEDWHFDHKSLTNNPNERLAMAKTIDKNLKSTASA